MFAIDADSHFVEPLDLFERRIGARFRDRAYKVQKDPATGKRQLVVDNKPLRLLDAEELLSAISGYAQKESGHDSGLGTCAVACRLAVACKRTRRSSRGRGRGDARR